MKAKAKQTKVSPAAKATLKATAIAKAIAKTIVIEKINAITKVPRTRTSQAKTTAITTMQSSSKSNSKKKISETIVIEKKQK